MTSKERQDCGIIIHYFTNLCLAGKILYGPDAAVVSNERFMVTSIAEALCEYFELDLSDDTYEKMAADALINMPIELLSYTCELSGLCAEHNLGRMSAAASSVSLLEAAAWTLAEQIAEMAKR